MLRVEFGGEPDASAGTEFYSGILVPGLVNAHCHLELSGLRGAIPRGGGFAAFARAVGPARRALPDADAFRAASAADAAMRAGGVAAAGDVCNSALTFPLKAGTGGPENAAGRGVLPGGATEYTSFIELYGLGRQDASAIEYLAEWVVERRIRYAATPHSLYSLGDAALKAVVSDSPFGNRVPARGGGGRPPLSVHFMESPAEAQLYRREGELWEWYRREGMTADFLHYGSPARRLVRCVPAERDILLVHNTFVTEEDIDLVERHFTGRVTWVLCPCSNDYISGAAPPVGLLRRKGVRLALGTDSLASNDALDMAAEMCRLPGVPLEELLLWATAGGAEGLGIDGRFGELEAGRRCGLAVLEGADTRRMLPAPGMRFRRLA